jgi:hypothetical protein
MKTLTVRQPYAHLIAQRIKRIENRTWKTPHRGPLLIHAGAARRSLDADTLDDLNQLGITIPATLDYGAIIAIVNLVDCVPLADLLPDLASDPFPSGPWYWIFADAHPVAAVPCRGRLGLWEATGSRSEDGRQEVIRDDEARKND